MNPKVSKQRLDKLIICGNYVEYIRYVTPISLEKRNHKVNKNKDKFEGKRFDNLSRARQTIRHLIWCNQGQYTKFVTLTYANAEFDIDKADYDFKQFIKKLRRRGYECPYLWISEHQKERGLKEGNEGSLHIHAVIFTDKYIPYDDINKCWGLGNTDIHSIKSIRNLGAYVCKYLTKEEFEQYHKHSYHVSRGLKRPEIFATDGYVGDYLKKELPGLFDNIDIIYSGTSSYRYVEPDGTIHENSFIYQQGKFKE